jgi:hypothetical protein
MNITIDVNIKASEEVTNSLLTLAAVLQNAVPVFDESKKAIEDKETQKKEKVTENKAIKKEDKKEEQKVITLEAVRTKLTSLSQSGKQAEVKVLIKKFGVAKLTDIPKEKYAELLKAAEEI